jgi:orotidine-5'-phosphate decarboxylase
VSGDGRIVVALDFENADEAISLVELLGDRSRDYKVGLQLLTTAGPSLVRELVSRGKRVFLDLKLLEIPNSVAGAVVAAGELGVSMVTVHACGGTAILRAAVRAARPYPQLKVVALTVITSMDDEDLAEVGVASTVQEQVLRLARLAARAGCHGVVASPWEASLLRARLPQGMLIVTPGTQLPDDGSYDHARAPTPATAVRAGSSQLVIGRSITKAADPRDAYERAWLQVAEALG